MSGLLKPVAMFQSPPQTIDCTVVSVPDALASIKSVSGAGNLISLSPIIDGSVTGLRIVIIADGITVADMTNVVFSGFDSYGVNLPMNVRFETSLDIQADKTGGAIGIVSNIYLG